MKEIILLKYGEIALKGANKGYFEKLLLLQLRYRLKKHGDFRVYSAQSAIYAEPLNGECDFEGAYDACKKTFGVIAISRAAEVAKNTDDILAAVREYAPAHLSRVQTFKVEARRSDKSFPLNSMQICEAAGSEILDAVPHLRVDVHKPQAVVRIEIRDYAAYIHMGQERGAGGMPVGSNGRALLLLSGGIDSPVAGYMVCKRGVKIEALHFESYPYTSERAREKVVELARILTASNGRTRLHIISVTEIQEQLRKCCDVDYFTLLLRRFMMTLAERCAVWCSCSALVTGESIGQVASQTMQALCVTDSVVSMPVFRPCIGLDKEEIVEISRRIGTFDTSVLPYEDCCTVFTPRHPKTKPEAEKVIREEKRVDFAGLCDRAFDTLYTINVD